MIETTECNTGRDWRQRSVVYGTLVKDVRSAGDVDLRAEPATDLQILVNMLQRLIKVALAYL